MRRIPVVGSAGAGRSTLSREVARRLGLPLIHQDRQCRQPGSLPQIHQNRQYRQPGWVAQGDARWRATVAEPADRPA
ncbi:hypothetical protein F6X68_13920 [Micromonospora sp. AMSO12t]|uniref:hypothetical protein n=1 Tax=Micromonospora sp. AMSO12t TaxID=2650410 RepID=UPI00124AE956|nr:hypothetical protein [Micromonospora sp. AMSO12t]KAB1153687.1 hypothetical protein F6X68_13920 [Micromonospora sp. AMSO12t]